MAAALLTLNVVLLPVDTQEDAALTVLGRGGTERIKVPRGSRVFRKEIEAEFITAVEIGDDTKRGGAEGRMPRDVSGERRSKVGAAIGIRVAIGPRAAGESGRVSAVARRAEQH